MWPFMKSDKKQKPTIPDPTGIYLCEDCYFPELNKFLRAKYPHIWDEYLRIGQENVKLKLVRIKMDGA